MAALAVRTRETVRRLSETCQAQSEQVSSACLVRGQRKQLRGGETRPVRFPLRLYAALPALAIAPLDQLPHAGSFRNDGREEPHPLRRKSAAAERRDAAPL